MTNLLGTLTQSLSGGGTDGIARQIGATPQQTQTAISAALPALLTALNRNTNSPQGAQSLATALDRDHDGSLLSNLPGLLSGALGGKAANGGGILGHILGGQRPQVEQGVAQASGLDMQQVARLLPLLAPLVMAALAQQKKQKNLDADGLSQALGQEAQEARKQAPPGLLGALSGFLDRDGDGQPDAGGLLQAGQQALGSLLGRKP